MILLTPYYESIYARGTDLWPSFAGKSVFIAGGTGFYGSWFTGFLHYLRDVKGVNVTVHSHSRKTGFNTLHIDTYPQSLKEADYVINAAGTPDTVDLLVHNKGPWLLSYFTKPSARYLGISTGGVTQPHGTWSAYTRAKWDGETVISWIPVVRPFATVGPGMDLEAHFAVAAFIRRARMGQPLEVSDKPITRSFCHIVDLVTQCLHVLVAGDGEPYEVGSDDPITIERAAQIIAGSTGTVNKVPTQFHTNANSSHYVADLTRIRTQFNLSLEWTSEQAIADTARYYGLTPSL